MVMMMCFECVCISVDSIDGELEPDDDDEVERKKTRLGQDTDGVRRHRNKTKIRSRNCPWTSEDIVFLRKSFQAFFKLRRPPDFKSIEVAQATFPQLQKRSKAQIKSRAWHLIQNGH